MASKNLWENEFILVPGWGTMVAATNVFCPYFTTGVCYISSLEIELSVVNMSEYDDSGIE